MVLEEDWGSDDNEDEDAPSMDTRFAHQISDSGHGRLKRRLLDCLAELAANKKGGTAVACSAMKEAEGNVIIWIARNQGFSDVDEIMFDKLEKMLGSLSCNSANQAEITLWEEMILYHQNRIANSYIPNLRASFKAYDAVRSRSNTNTLENSSASDAALSILRTLLFDHNTNDISTLERHKRLVIASYNLRRRRDIEEILYRSPSATSRSKGLWLDICLLARLRVAFQNFKDIALTLPSFEQITIILAHCPLSSANPSQCPLNLKQTFGILQLDQNPATTKAVLGQNWTITKIEREFAKRQKQRPNIHAEVQMLMFLNTNESSISSLYPYFGCSKLSCFLCHRFIESYGRFTTRGCHGRLFKPWTVPGGDRLLPGRADQTAKALILVQREVEEKLKASVEGHIPHERTSVIGGSSIFGLQQEERSQRQIQIAQLKIKAEQDRVAELFKRYASLGCRWLLFTSSHRDRCAKGQRQTQNAINSARRTCSITEGGKLDTECDICMRPTTRKCSFCSKGFFCSDSCQEEMPARHLFTCSKRPLTSADYLWESMSRDLMPQDEDVLEDFGFNNVLSSMDRSYLLGVYGGLYLSGKVSPEDLHGWRVGGVLIDKIKDYYHSIPENSRGQYFPWFLKNLYVLERPTTKDEAQERLIATFYDKARPYLDIEDRNKTARDLKPEAKGLSYNLLAEILLRSTPNPIEVNWYSFGFVTCHGQHEESLLVDLYQLLLVESDGSFFYEFHNSRRNVTEPVTFTQFWKAYEAGKLIELMDSKGLNNLRSNLPFLEDFLSVPPPGTRSSVWDLKQFIEINSPIDHPPIPSVDVDYGFVNCRTFEETCILMEVYRKVLETANPLELHQACVAGDLFQFAKSYVQMEEQWRSLLRNFYPLEEVVGQELGPELSLEAESEVDEDSAGLPSLLSRLWAFIGGFANK